MTTRYRVRLANSHLDQIDKNIAILNIEYSDPEKQVAHQTIANLDGFDIQNEKTIRQTVKITFEIHIYDTATRNKICQAVNAWAAAGGILRTSDRDGQFLQAKCEQYAAINARDWTAPLTLVFTSTTIPYWQTYETTTKTISGKNVSSKMKIDGNTSSAFVQAEITSTKGTLKSVKLTAGSSVVELSGLSIPKDDRISIDYISDRYLRIRWITAAGKNKGSLIAKVKPTSSDSLLIPSGKESTIGIVADNDIKCAFSARGLWI